MSSPIALPLSWLRGISAAFLPDAAEILRYAETNTADGVAQTWATVASGVPCRVSQSSATAVERDAEGVLRSLSDWRIWLPFDTDVTERDRITVTATDHVDGRTFEVRRVDEKTYETSRRVLCALVT